MPMTDDVPVIGELRAHAVSYAELGLEVFPVDPETKQPMAARHRGAPSQYSATTDVATIEMWWNTWPDALIGHRLPEDQVVLDIDPRHGGAETWRALTAELGFDTKATRVHISGRGDGGGHVTYRRPPGKLTISTLDAWARERGTGEHLEAADRHVCGLDLLHRTHRYTILPPSPHPETGQPYRWRQFTEPAEMPAALAALIVDSAPPPPPRADPAPYSGESIADWYTATRSWNDLLPRHGWTLRAGDGDSDGSQWRHPTATSPVSATVRHGCLFIYSPNTPFEVTAPNDPHGVTRFAAHTLLDHGGDASSAARAARELKDGPNPRPRREGDPFGRVDGGPPANADAEDLDDQAEEPARPSVEVYWADEVAADPPPPIDELVTNLVAVGEITVFGAPRAMGKTWATMALAEAVSAGRGRLFGSEHFDVDRSATVMYLQGELGRTSSHVRWNLATGGKPPHVAEVFERLRVKTTARRISQAADGVTWTDEESVATIDHRLEPLLAELGVELLVVDPWATYFAGNENSNDEVEAAIDAITQMARRVGCAVWIVHHISAKATHGNLAEPEDLWRGASRLADAVATRVTLLPHFTPAKARELGLDRFQARRYGDLHVLARNGPPVPVVHTQLDRFEWAAWEPVNPEGGRPPVLSDRDVVDALRDGPITSKRRLMDALDVGSHATLNRHLERLIELGVVVVEDGPKRSNIYRLVDEGGLP